MVAEKCLRMCLGMIVGVCIARYLGPEDFGLLSFALALVSLLIPLSRAGLDSIMIRELIGDPGERDEILRAGFFIRSVGALAAIILIAAAALAIVGGHPDRRFYLIVLIAASVLFHPFDILEQYFQARIIAKYSSLCRMGQTVILAIVRLGLIAMDASVQAFAAVTILETLLLAVFLILTGRSRGVPLLTGRVSMDRALNLLRFSWPMILSGLAVSMYMRIDQIMIEKITGSRDVGLYSAAIKLSEVWFGLMAVFSASLLPVMISKIKTSPNSGYRYLQKVSFGLIWANIALAVVMTFYGGWVLPIVFGNAYEEGVSVLMIHVWTGPFVALGLVSGNWLIANNYQTLMFFRTLSGLLINISLNLLLIPRIGITGAASASLLSQVGATFVFDVFNPKTRKLFLVKMASFITPNHWK